jgi:predicted TIM-barrel fold metal-dependent hydrolase
MMAQVVNQTMGDDVLMFGSDYPHAESRFPDSVDIVQAWDLPPESKKKLFRANAERCFRLEGV